MDYWSSRVLLYDALAQAVQLLLEIQPDNEEYQNRHLTPPPKSQTRLSNVHEISRYLNLPLSCSNPEDLRRRGLQRLEMSAIYFSRGIAVL